MSAPLVAAMGREGYPLQKISVAGRRSASPPAEATSASKWIMSPTGIDLGTTNFPVVIMSLDHTGLQASSEVTYADAWNGLLEH